MKHTSLLSRELIQRLGFSLLTLVTLVTVVPILAVFAYLIK